MPTYEYKCTACSHVFEQFQSMKDKALTKCPSCGKNKLERLIGTGAAVIFKGSGFYQTDYRSEAYRKSAEAETKASTPPSEAAKTDAKPEGSKTEAAKPAEAAPAVKITESAPKSSTKGSSKRKSSKAK